MHAPYRTAAPPEPEKPDAFDAYEQILRERSGSMPRLVVLMCAAITLLWVAVSFGQRKPRAVAAETAAAEASRRVAKASAAIDQARAQALEEQRLFEDAVHDAITSSAPTGESPCPVALPTANRLFQDRPAFPMVVVGAGERDIPSPSVAAVLADVGRAEAHLAGGRTFDGLLYAKALASGERPRLTYDVVLVTSVMQHPSRRDHQSYEPGEVTGRAYLYDFASHRVTCAGEVHAASSKQIAYSFASGETTPANQAEGPSLSASLDADLQRQLERSIASALFAL